MLKISNKTVEKFILRFEERFGDILTPSLKLDTMTQKLPPQYSNNFSVCVSEYKFSDWDVHCSIVEGDCNISILKDMEYFVRSFKDFGNVGLILTPLLAHASDKYHFIDTKTVLQFMAFMPNTKNAPFIDIHIENIPTGLLKEMYQKISGQEFIDWILITYWRKRRNGESADSLFWFLNSYIIPVYPNNEMLIKKDPILFCEKNLEGRSYDAIISHLKNA